MSNNNGMEDLKKTLNEVTQATIGWMRENVIKDDYGAMSPLLEHALTAVVPASDRAVLVRYGCELMGYDWHEALPGMAAFEFQNINLLVTDDYFDDRNTKRMGVDPISSKWGSKSAVALGFILKSMSNESLIVGWNKNPNWDLQSAIETIEWASKWQYYSQFLEDELSAMPLANITINDYTNLIEKATAVGIAGALELGCILGQCNSGSRKKARELGMNLGCLLQIRDDCLDYICNESLIHKGPLCDLFAKRKRLPLLVAYWEGTGKEKRHIERMLNKTNINISDTLMIIEFILADKVKNKIYGYSQQFADAGISVLKSMPQVHTINKKIEDLIVLFSDL